jgi:hypothetical protein
MASKAEQPRPQVVPPSRRVPREFDPNYGVIVPQDRPPLTSDTREIAVERRPVQREPARMPLELAEVTLNIEDDIRHGYL